MLKITKLEADDHRVTLKLEGRVAGAWVRVLERELTLSRGPGRQVELDLSSVTYLAPEGIDLLDVLLFGGVRIVNCSNLVRTMLRQAPGPRIAP